MFDLATNLRFVIFFFLPMNKAVIKDNSLCRRPGGWTLSFAAGEECIWTSFWESCSRTSLVVTETNCKLV